MVANAQKKWTVEEYLSFERQSEEKHEYWDGEVFPVGHPPKTPTQGTGRRHSLIITNTIRSIGNQLNNSYEVYSSDMSIHLNTTKFTNPDISVVSGEPQFANDECDVLLNPTVIIEVLSPSTELDDRGKKFGGYRMLESLQEYLLIEQSETSIAHYTRQSDGDWRISVSNSLDSAIELPSINCTLLLADVYRKVTFEADDNAKDA